MGNEKTIYSLIAKSLPIILIINAIIALLQRNAKRITLEPRQHHYNPGEIT
jgi:hypothetical protein